MQQTYDPLHLEAAQAGDQDAFQNLIEPYRHELLVHCYRILGSIEDAEDILQETLLRAWKRLSTFEGRAPLRAWLYKIATNAALDALDRLKSRGLPTSLIKPAAPDAALPGLSAEGTWLEPIPDALADDLPEANPEARYEAHESITLAFLAALQRLPGRQRAALILKDVLGLDTAQIAEILEMSSAAVNSALQRARATMQQEHKPYHPPRTDDALITSLLARYVTAWETADSGALVALLREDAALTMPPLPAWYLGREAIRLFLDNVLFVPPMARPMHLIPTRANGCPAFAVYQPDETGVFRPMALHVLTIEQGQISVIDDFLSFDGSIFPRFGLPSSL